jgi:hypothetical protein
MEHCAQLVGVPACDAKEKLDIDRIRSLALEK